jgi:predicted nuclease of restriction endonuclease-like (RecB) superfamily
MLFGVDSILELSKKGQTISVANDIIRDPYILDFLKIPEPHHFTENELEACSFQQLLPNRIG